MFGHKISQCPVSKAPPVSVSGMPSGTKVAGHGNCDKVNAESSSKILHAATPGEEWRDGVDSVVDSIGTRQSIVIQDNIRVTIHEATTSPMRHDNRLEYITISEYLTDEVAGAAFTDASTVTFTYEVANVASTDIVILDIAECSDSSPIFDSFKQVKRIDELDFTPQPLTLSKSKLKRLRKQNRVPQQEDGSNVTRPHD